MGVPVPIFPLGVVLFPGLPLSLHIFEDRYRRLVQHLLDLDDDERCLGVVAIRDGYEVGDLAVHSAHRVGCEAVLSEVRERSDGRFDIEVIGRRRLRVDGMDESQPYLVGDVTYLDDTEGEGAAEAAAKALAAFQGYRERLAAMQGTEIEVADLPDEPLMLSYALAAGGLFMLGDRQALLEDPDAAARLHRLARLLRSETAAMTALPSLPATEVARTGWSPN
ncbi:MAG: peptidase [Nocardioidaceae bacterium]|jgi:Lon protease-like protein|nr:peptidase [Nocardioidaceae bacterium]